jgi:hypothetical protein
MIEQLNTLNISMLPFNLIPTKIRTKVDCQFNSDHYKDILDNLSTEQNSIVRVQYCQRSCIGIQNVHKMCFYSATICRLLR